MNKTTILSAALLVLGTIQGRVQPVPELAVLVTEVLDLQE